MNFPHKSLTKTATESDANDKSAFHALLAHAIARQSLSHSAQSYVARTSDVGSKAPMLRSLWMEDRINFFAGDFSEQQTAGCHQGLFLNGHFRPDLVEHILSGEIG